MSKVVIKYSQRLGDIIRCFPLAKFFNGRGEDVYIECKEEYWDIFECVSYVAPCTPGDTLEFGYKGAHVLDIEIWPRRYNEFRAGGLSWMDFVYQDFVMVKDRKIRMDRLDHNVSEYRLPRDYVLVAPFGISVDDPPDPKAVVKMGLKMANSIKAHLYVLTGPGEVLVDFPKSRQIKARKLRHLPVLIQNAKKFLTINSAPSIIGSAVRKEYSHVVNKAHGGQDDFYAPNQIRIEDL